MVGSEDVQIGSEVADVVLIVLDSLLRCGEKTFWETSRTELAQSTNGIEDLSLAAVAEVQGLKQCIN